MRVPVVDGRGMPLMPCTPPKARALLKAGQARPKRNKLGLFYLQHTYEQEPNNQRLVVGIDPGAAFEGYSVVGTKETVCNLMVEAPTHVKNASRPAGPCAVPDDFGCGGDLAGPTTGSLESIASLRRHGVAGKPKRGSCGTWLPCCP
jgi:hypothetical protein